MKVAVKPEYTADGEGIVALTITFLPEPTDEKENDTLKGFLKRVKETHHIFVSPEKPRLVWPPVCPLEERKNVAVDV